MRVIYQQVRQNLSKILYGIAIVAYVLIAPITLGSYDITSSAVADEDMAVLEITVKGPPDNLDIVLNDPNKRKADSGFISEDEFTSKTAHLKLWMTDYPGKSPKPGVYTLILKSYSTGVQYRTNFSFKGAALNITEVRTINRYSYGWDIQAVAMNVVNDGDLPAVIDRGEIGVKEDANTVVKEDLYLIPIGISPGEEKIITGNPILTIPNNGTYTAGVLLYSSDGSVIARYVGDLILGTEKSIKDTPTKAPIKNTPAPTSPGLEATAVVASLIMAGAALRRSKL